MSCCELNSSFITIGNSIQRGKIKYIIQKARDDDIYRLNTYYCHSDSTVLHSVMSFSPQKIMYFLKITLNMNPDEIKTIMGL